MSILVRFTGAPGLTAAQYDAVMPSIEAAGSSRLTGSTTTSPSALAAASASARSGTRWRSSRPSVERLMPLLAEGGIELAGPPEVIEIHNIIKR